MTDAERLTLIVAVGLAVIAGLGLGVAVVGWIRQGLADLEKVFKL